MVSLRRGGKVNFLEGRTILRISEYDALLLLKANTRLSPETWTFTVADELHYGDQENIIITKEEPVDNLSLQESFSEPKQKLKKANKGGRNRGY